MTPDHSPSDLHPRLLRQHMNPIYNPPLNTYQIHIVMRNYLISISDELSEQIEDTIQRWGFVSKNEFFRFAAIDFIRNDGRAMPAESTLEGMKKAILSVKGRRETMELISAWKKENPYLSSDMK